MGELSWANAGRVAAAQAKASVDDINKDEIFIEGSNQAGVSILPADSSTRVNKDQGRSMLVLHAAVFADGQALAGSL